MEPFDFVHSIKAEKANALARYRLFTNIAKAIQLMEVFVAVVLVSWSSTRLPSVVKFSSEYVLALMSYLTNQHVVFLVGNVIVFVCYMLSRYTDSGSHFDDGTKDDQLIVTNIPKSVQLQVTESPMISNEKAVVETVTKPEVVVVRASIEQAAKQIERFRRSQSDLKRKISVKDDQRELRRSVTAESFPAVDKLSNEEFRIAVETFISKQQRFLKQQRLVEDES